MSKWHCSRNISYYVTRIAVATYAVLLAVMKMGNATCVIMNSAGSKNLGNTQVKPINHAFRQTTQC